MFDINIVVGVTFMSCLMLTGGLSVHRKYMWVLLFAKISLRRGTNYVLRVEVFFFFFFFFFCGT
jgi:hypothetical protein